ncbi:MAG: hypothetical protein ACR2PI_22205 [Hyphomicrobiaceae bacterium]
MTNRLYILERERERLEAVLAEDPHWQALCEIQRRAPAAGRPQVLSADIVAGLNRNETFATYRRVVRAIAQIKKAEAAAQTEPPAERDSEQPGQAPRPDKRPSPGPIRSSSPAGVSVPVDHVDDLTAIRRIDRKTATALNNLGIFSYRTIAQWNRHDVRAVRDALDLGKRIWRENWIEQAAVLQLRKTDTVRVVSPAPTPAAAQHQPTIRTAPVVDEPPLRAPEARSATPKPAIHEVLPAAAQVQPQSRPVDVAAAAMSAELPSSAKSDAAEAQPEPKIDPNPMDCASPTGAPEEPHVSPAAQLVAAHPGQEPGEQAPDEKPAIVPRGEVTAAPEPVAQKAQPKPPILDQATTSSVGPAATTNPVVPPAPEQNTPAPPVRPAPTLRETFKVGQRPRRLPAPAARRFSYICGVSDTTAEALRSAGVTSLSDIASWSRADVKWFRAILGDNAHISRDQWIEQAALLSKGIWTRHALRVVNGETRLLVAAPSPLEVGEPAFRVDVPAPELVAAQSDSPAEEVIVATDATLKEPDATAASALDQSTAGEAEKKRPSAPVAATPEEVDEPAPEPPQAAPEVVETRARARVVTALFSEQIPRPTPIDDVSQAPTPSNENDAPEAYPQSPEDIARHSGTKAADSRPPPSERIKPMRGLTTTIALGKIKRPPPDLGTLPRHLVRPPMAPPARPTEQPEPPAVAPEPTQPQVEPAIPGPRKPPPLNEEEPTQRIATEASPDVNLADDWSDAEALVIKHAEPAVAPAEQPRSTAASPPTIVAPPEDDAPASSPDDDYDTGTAVPWSEEAEVVIVSRPGSEAPAPAAPEAPVSPVAMARERIGAASDFITDRIKRARSFSDDTVDDAGTNISFRDNIEEATVTIIRAESSQEDASTVMPNDVANDEEAPNGPEKKKSVRAIGSRFLKALTGD